MQHVELGAVNIHLDEVQKEEGPAGIVVKRQMISSCAHRRRDSAYQRSLRVEREVGIHASA
jgi:hypothetical protein